MKMIPLGSTGLQVSKTAMGCLPLQRCEKEYAINLLRKAYERSRISENPEYQQFLAENRWWLDDYALFMALKKFFKMKKDFRL